MIKAVSGAIAGVAAAALSLAPLSAEAVTSRCGDTLLYAGKGGQYGTTGENTLPKFAGAYSAGFDGVETDVRPTADKDLVMFHDKNLAGLSSNTYGYVDDRSTSYVLSTILDRGGSIPTYIQFLDQLASRGRYAVVEVKPSIHWTSSLFDTALLRPAAARGLLDQIIFDSVTNKYLPMIDAINPAANTAVKGAKARDGYGVLKTSDSVVTGAGWDASYVSQVQNAGGDVVLTGTNSGAWAEALPKGPDGIASADARGLLAWCNG
jgi:glycerophosphoryl diester phosphodiesterase